jgi:hypothetical protein
MSFMIYMWITNSTMLDGIIFFATTFTQIFHNIYMDYQYKNTFDVTLGLKM